MLDLGPIHFVTRVDRHLSRNPVDSRACRHGHHIISLHRVAGGEILLGDETHQVSGPFLCLLPEGDRDDNTLHGRDRAWWCAFSGQAVRPAIAGAQVLHEGMCTTLPRVHSIDAVTAGRAEMLFRELQVALTGDGLVGRLTALARLNDLLALWAATGAGAAADEVEVFRERIEAQAHDPQCALENLAREVGRHPDALTASFRRRYGCTPVVFCTRLRLQRARELLAGAGHGGLAAIAVACGFPDPGYFCRVFRRHVGTTPRDWARRFGSGME